MLENSQTRFLRETDTQSPFGMLTTSKIIMFVDIMEVDRMPKCLWNKTSEKAKRAKEKHKEIEIL